MVRLTNYLFSPVLSLRVYVFLPVTYSCKTGSKSFRTFQSVSPPERLKSVRIPEFYSCNNIFALRNDIFRARNDVFAPRNCIFRPRNCIFAPRNCIFCPRNCIFHVRNSIFRARNCIFHVRNCIFAPRNDIFRARNAVSRARNDVSNGYFSRKTDRLSIFSNTKHIPIFLIYISVSIRYPKNKILLPTQLTISYSTI